MTSTSISTSRFESESIVPLANGRTLYYPDHPAPCSYIRVVENGEEIIRWDQAQWCNDPARVMGAIMNAVQGGHIDTDLEEDSGETEEDLIAPDATDEDAPLTNAQMETAERLTGQRV